MAYRVKGGTLKLSLYQLDFSWGNEEMSNVIRMKHIYRITIILVTQLLLKYPQVVGECVEVHNKCGGEGFWQCSYRDDMGIGIEMGVDGQKAAGDYSVG